MTVARLSSIALTRSDLPPGLSSVKLLPMPAATTREIVLGVLDSLPQDTPLSRVARELEFISAVREGFSQLDRGEGMPLEEVERLLPTWARNSLPPTP